VGDVLQSVFAWVCWQGAAHTWMPGGEMLPFCQRCTGLYAGAALALALHMTLRIRPSDRFLQIHGVFLLAMIPLGYHWVPQDAVIRAVSGFANGFGIVSFLWLLPSQLAWRVRPLTPTTSMIYAGAMVAGIAAVPALGMWGGAAAANGLVAAALLGLTGMAALAAANLTIGAWWLCARVSDRLAGVRM
jgi:uncharacterized membrane protein